MDPDYPIVSLWEYTCAVTTCFGAQLLSNWWIIACFFALVGSSTSILWNMGWGLRADYEDSSFGFGVCPTRECKGKTAIWVEAFVRSITSVFAKISNCLLPDGTIRLAPLLTPVIGVWSTCEPFCAFFSLLT